MAAAAAASSASPAASVEAAAAFSGGRNEVKAELLKLLDQRQVIEDEMDTLRAALGTDGLTLSLVDDEGFPRADLDIVAITHARARYSILQTNYTRMMAQMELGLEVLHSMPLPEGEAESAASASSASSETPALPRRVATPSSAPALAATGGATAKAIDYGVDCHAPALALVRGTLPDGPAHAAGMRSGMEVLRFGTATAESLAASGQGLDALSGIAAASAGGAVEVVVRSAQRQTATAPAEVPAGADADADAAALSRLSVLVVRVPSPPRLGMHLVLPTAPKEGES